MKKMIRKIFCFETLGIAVQVVLWAVFFFVLFSVLLGGFNFGEFRYVGY